MLIMRSLALLISAGALPLALGDAFYPASSSPEPKGLLRFPAKGSLHEPSEVNNVSKRQVSVPSESQLFGTLYTIDVTIGTPGQTVSLQISTGSAESWVNPACHKSFNPQLCLEAGRLTASTSLTDLYTQGTSQYPSGYVEWNYLYDYWQIGG